MRIPSISAWAVALLTLSTQAAELISVSPISNTILQLVFDDGWIEQAAHKHKRSDVTVHELKLSLVDAAQPQSYSLSSPDDPAFNNGMKPLAVYRKSKPEETAPPDKYVYTHYVYLKFPRPLVQGKSYTVNTGTLAANMNDCAFIFNFRTIRSDAVKVNQLGYQPASDVKYGYISQWMGDGGGADLSMYTDKPFHILDARTGVTAFTGAVRLRSASDHDDMLKGNTDLFAPHGNMSNADVYECDFSAFTTPGEYVLAVENMGHSYRFLIHEDAYRMAFYHSLRGLWHQRAGYAKTLPYTRWEFEADFHGLEDTPVWGWYHDAGDWDGYPKHINIPAHLLLAFDVNSEAFKDGEMNTPESGNGIADILDEASWLLNFLMRTRSLFDGLVCGGRVENGGQSMIDDGKSVKPELDNYYASEDTRVWLYDSGSTEMTGYYAGLCGWLADLLARDTNRPDHVDDSIAKWKSEALSAYAHAAAGESKAVAAAGAFRATAESKYESDLATYIGPNKLLYDSWGNTQKSLPYWMYALAVEGVTNEDLRRDAISSIVKTADEWYVNTAAAVTFRKGNGKECPEALGALTTPWMDNLVAAHKLTGDTKYLSTMQTTADYCLGNNPLNMVWMTGTGDNRVTGAHHTDCFAHEYRDLFPGITPYGPTTMDWNWNTVYSAVKTYERFFPQPYKSYPIGERWCNTRWAIASNEWTVNQNMSTSVNAYGSLLSASSPLPVNKEPFVAITGPAVAPGANQFVVIKANAHDPDGSITHVDYYEKRRFIGRAVQPPFTLVWKAPPAGIYEIEATAYDNSGDHWYSNRVEVTVGADVVDTQAPAAPRQVNCTATSPMSALVDWIASADNDIAGYEVYVDGQLQTMMPTGGTHCNLAGIENVAQKVIHVKAVDLNGNRSELSGAAARAAHIPQPGKQAALSKAVFPRICSGTMQMISLPLDAKELKVFDLRGRVLGAVANPGSKVNISEFLPGSAQTEQLLIIRSQQCSSYLVSTVSC